MNKKTIGELLGETCMFHCKNCGKKRKHTKTKTSLICQTCGEINHERK